jgi:hypothetical protein
MRLEERQVTQWQPFCEWCGINVGGWYSVRRTNLRILARHRMLHRKQGRIGQSIRAVDYP